LLLLDSYFFGVGSTMLPPSGISVQASSTSDNVINIIFRLPEYVFLHGLSDSPSTVALRGQSIRVHASWTPLRIPPAGMQVDLVALVDAAVFISGPWTSLYQGFPLGIFLYFVWFNIYVMFSSKKNSVLWTLTVKGHFVGSLMDNLGSLLHSLPFN